MRLVYTQLLLTLDSYLWFSQELSWRAHSSWETLQIGFSCLHCRLCLILDDILFQYRPESNTHLPMPNSTLWQRIAYQRLQGFLFSKLEKQMRCDLIQFPNDQSVAQAESEFNFQRPFPRPFIYRIQINGPKVSAGNKGGFVCFAWTRTQRSNCKHHSLNRVNCREPRFIRKVASQQLEGGAGTSAWTSRKTKQFLNKDENTKQTKKPSK